MPLYVFTKASALKFWDRPPTGHLAKRWKIRTSCWGECFSLEIWHAKALARFQVAGPTQEVALLHSLAWADRLLAKQVLPGWMSLKFNPAAQLVGWTTLPQDLEYFPICAIKSGTSPLRVSGDGRFTEPTKLN
jgi:hypothetical protein